MIDVTIPSYFIGGVVVYYLTMFLLSIRHRRPTQGGEDLTFVICVPALNEERVIDETVKKLLALDHPRVVLCIADDASSDQTWQILSAYSSDPRAVLIRRELPWARRGKSDVLNSCFSEIQHLLSTDHPLLGSADPAKVVVGVVDADGRLDGDCLSTVAPYLADPKIAGVQIGVRIFNADTNLLTRLQDMEFVGFCSFVQRARDRLGSTGLGGNGQFTRLSALIDLHQARGGPWRVEALTEDLELGLALICRGWEMRFCPHTWVAQQGLPSWKPLFRQRTRWIQGHYSCWRYLPRLLPNSRVAAVTRLDVSAYLLLIVTVVVATFNAIVGLGGSFAGFHVANAFGDFIPSGPERNAFNLICGIGPLPCFLYVYQRNALRPFNWWQLPAVGLLFTLYTYVWILGAGRALLRTILGRQNWVKTPRVADRRPGIVLEPVTGES